MKEMDVCLIQGVYGGKIMIEIAVYVFLGICLLGSIFIVVNAVMQAVKEKEG